MWDSFFIGQAIMDEKFDAGCTECQIFLSNFCKELNELDIIIPGSSECWFADFEEHIGQWNLKVPLTERGFHMWIRKWIDETQTGKQFEAK